MLRTHITLTLLAITVGSVLVPQLAFALTSVQTPVQLSGYAWSSNIGWISFSGTNYGVVEDTATGNLSSYAWSSNIGWISFNQTSGCPEAGCVTQPNIDLSTGIVSGWAQVLSADGNGWDGWIKLGGTWSPAVRFIGTSAVGYSWGSDVVGWVSWSGTGYGVSRPLPPPPTCTATFGASAIPVNGAVNFSWTGDANTTSATYSCTTGVNPSPGSGAASGSQVMWFSSVGVKSCSVNVSGPGGTGTCSSSITVNPDPGTACRNTTINHCVLSGAPLGGQAGHCAMSYGVGSRTCQYTCTASGWQKDNNTCAQECQWGLIDGSCILPYLPSQKYFVDSPASTGTCISQGSNNGTHNCSYQCTASPGQYGTWVQVQNACAVNAPSNATPTAYITASPMRVKSGSSTTVSWSASGVYSCTITGPNLNSTSFGAATTTRSVSIATQSTYKISCDNGAASSRVIVNVVPVYGEF